MTPVFGVVYEKKEVFPNLSFIQKWLADAQCWLCESESLLNKFAKIDSGHTFTLTPNSILFDEQESNEQDTDTISIDKISEVDETKTNEINTKFSAYLADGVKNECRQPFYCKELGFAMEKIKDGFTLKDLWDVIPSSTSWELSRGNKNSNKRWWAIKLGWGFPASTYFVSLFFAQFGFYINIFPKWMLVICSLFMEWNKVICNIFTTFVGCVFFLYFSFYLVSSHFSI